MSIPSRWRTIACVLAVFLVGLPAAATAQESGGSAAERAEAEFPSGELEDGTSAADLAEEGFPSDELDDGTSAADLAEEGFPSSEMEDSAATAVLEEDEFSSSDLKAYADVEERIEALEEEWKNALVDSSSAQEVVSRRAETRQQREDLLHEHGLDLRSYRAIRAEVRMNRELRERLDRLADDDTD